MRILVISDTHIPTAAKSMPQRILEEAHRSDACIHCGDFVEFSVYEQLARIIKLYAVYGNMDDRPIKTTLPRRIIITLGGLRLGITHGKGAAENITKTVLMEFEDKIEEIDMLVFGHSHQPLDKTYENKIYFNPGSPTDKVFSPYASYGIIEVGRREIKRRIVKIE